jgi:predicted Zn finger-like uncharacterized protein
MILTCPNCASRFLISAEALAPSGRRVKCSACGTQWFQAPDSDAADDETQSPPARLIDEDIPHSVKPHPSEESPLPHEELSASALRKNIAGYGAAFGVFCAVFGVLLLAKPLLVASWPASASLYERLGFAVALPGEGLVFDRLKAVADAGGALHVEGLIINLTRKTQAVPLIEVSLRTIKGEILKQWYIQPPQAEIAGEQNVPFKAQYSEGLSGAENINLQFVLTPDSKTALKGGDNIPAPPADAPADPHAGGSH